MTALATRKESEFARQAALYVGVFAVSMRLWALARHCGWAGPFLIAPFEPCTSSRALRRWSPPGGNQTFRTIDIACDIFPKPPALSLQASKKITKVTGTFYARFWLSFVRSLGRRQ
jgi:hypothetical protein